jgi:simple sugar transport system permease protein
VSWKGAAAGPAIALLIAMAAGSLLILAYGQSPAHVYALMLRGTLGLAYGLGQVLFKATPLLFTGLAVALALRAGLFNIGAEGQLLVGAFLSALCGAHLGGLPALLAVPLCLAAGAGGGAAYASIAGALKARFGAHEVITTIMLNFIAAAMINWIGTRGGLYLRESQHTQGIALGARLPRLSQLVPSLAGSAANGALILGLAVCALGAYLLFRTRLGYEIRAVGLAPLAAETARISLPRTTIVALALSGAAAGLGGANFVLGYKYYFEEGFSGGAGYMGIAVAVLARNHPLAIIPAALFFGALSQGGLVVNFLVPKELVDVLQAVVIVAVAVATAHLQRQRVGRAASGAGA